jgi:hypothetical protein
MRAILIASLVVASCLGACGGRRIVPLLSSAGVPITRTPSGGIPLEVVTRSTSVKDPLPVSGSGVVYGDFEAALGHAVSSAAVPWADANRGRRPGGWQLFVEVINAEAEHDGSRLVVGITVRATLQTRVGGAHIAQTETACRDGGLVEADKGAPVLYACMTRIGRDLTSWLPSADPGMPRKSGNAPPRAPGEVPIGGAVGNFGAHADTDGDGDSDTPGESD